MIVASLAAFMSTFAATVNAAPAYIVNDIYKRFLNPHATPKTYVAMSYCASSGRAGCGTAFGLCFDIAQPYVEWIVDGTVRRLHVLRNVLKWYWWRFNGYGYFWRNAGRPPGAMAVGASTLLSTILHSDLSNSST